MKFYKLKKFYAYLLDLSVHWIGNAHFFQTQMLWSPYIVFICERLRIYFSQNIDQKIKVNIQ